MKVDYKALGLAACIILGVLGVTYLIILWVNLTYKLPIIVSLSPIIIGGFILVYWAIKGRLRKPKHKQKNKIKWKK